MTEAAAPQKVTANVKEFVRLDDGLKKAREEMKGVRKAMEECRELIIQYMRDADVERLGIKKGSQFLELAEKQLKVRATAEVVKEKIKDLMARGVTDPEAIYEEISKCGGTKQVWKLSRRSKRTAKPKKETEGADPDGKKPPKKKKKTADSGL